MVRTELLQPEIVQSSQEASSACALALKIPGRREMQRFPLTASFDNVLTAAHASLPRSQPKSRRQYPISLLKDICQMVDGTVAVKPLRRYCAIMLLTRKENDARLDL